MLIKTLDLVCLYLEHMNTSLVNLMTNFVWGNSYRSNTLLNRALPEAEAA